ncbi:MAG: hypothetical protein LUE17_00005 [Planctomycetaceae bacterium]|nr:hypothetical protein [Planctomycetaceae bacterium]
MHIPQPPEPHIPAPSEDEVCEKAWQLAKADNPNLHNRDLFFHPVWATPPQGAAGVYWRETIRGHWIKLAAAALTRPGGAAEAPPPSPHPIPAPTEAQVGEAAWAMAREQIPSMPLHYKRLFLWPEWASPPRGEIYPYWKTVIKGFFCRVAREKLIHPERFPEPAKRETEQASGPVPPEVTERWRPRRQSVFPTPQKRHDRFFPVRTPTELEVRRKALELAAEDAPWMSEDVRGLFFHPDWAAPPPGDMGVYWRCVIKGCWFVVARDALQREYNALPRVRMPRRRWKDRRQPNPYRSWTRRPLKNGPPPQRRRICRIPGLCVDAAMPADLFPTRPGAPPGRPWEERTPAAIRHPEEDRAPHPFPPGRPGGFNSAQVMLLDIRIEEVKTGSLSLKGRWSRFSLLMHEKKGNALALPLSCMMNHFQCYPRK